MKRFVRRKNVDVGLTRTSVGTTSRSRKNSERSRAISAKEFWNRWEKMLAIWIKCFVNTHLDLPILSERITEEELTSVVPGSMVRATNFPAKQKTFRSWNILLENAWKASSCAVLEWLANRSSLYWNECKWCQDAASRMTIYLAKFFLFQIIFVG